MLCYISRLNPSSTFLHNHAQYSSSSHLFTVWINAIRIKISVWLLVPAFNNRQGPRKICGGRVHVSGGVQTVVRAQEWRRNSPHSHPHPSRKYETSNHDPQPSSPKMGAAPAFPLPPQDFFHLFQVSTAHAAAPILQHQIPSLYNCLVIISPPFLDLQTADQRSTRISVRHPGSIAAATVGVVRGEGDLREGLGCMLR